MSVGVGVCVWMSGTPPGVFDPFFQAKTPREGVYLAQITLTLPTRNTLYWFSVICDEPYWCMRPRVRAPVASQTNAVYCVGHTIEITVSDRQRRSLEVHQSVTARGGH